MYLKIFIAKVLFEQTLEQGKAVINLDTLCISIPGRENIKCKGPGRLAFNLREMTMH